MSVAIRIVLIIVSFATVAFMFANIRRSRMRIEDSIFWAVLAALLLLLSLFPQIGIFVSRILGFQAPINFVFLFFIFVLVVKCFSLSRQLSHQETLIKELAQHIAIDKLAHAEKNQRDS